MPEHLLAGIIQFKNNVQILLNRYGLNEYRVSTLFSYDERTKDVFFSDKTSLILEEALYYADSFGSELSTLLYLFLALLNVESEALDLIKEVGIDVDELYSELLSKLNHTNNKNVLRPIRAKSENREERRKVRSSVVKEEYSPKSSLAEDIASLGVDLTEKAYNGKIDPVIGRDKEIDRVIQILSRRTKNNPILIGEAGVGKTAIVEGLALAVVNGEVPPCIKNKRIFSLDVAGLLAGTKYRGEFEERLKNLVDSIRSSGDVIMFIDEIHTVVSAGSTEGGAMDMANILKPFLARGELLTIGATTQDEYLKYIKKDPALDRRFQPVTVEAPDVDSSIEILKGIRFKYEDFHHVKITDDALVAAVKLSEQYIQDRFLPDKAIDVIDEACSLKKMSDKGGEVTAEDVAKVVGDWTGIPINKLTSSETAKLMSLEEILSKRVIGQEEAVKAVSVAVRRARAGLKDPKRPIGCFMFLGPTGVGKTELCKALASALFGDENKILRFDMSEYQDKTSIQRLLGGSPGYVGYDEAGLLTEKVRRNPYSVVLFDEIEKAHTDIFNLLLQVMDEGRLTDSHGRTVSFKETVIIMTSNLGARDYSRANIGFVNAQDLKNTQLEALKNYANPEFINRIDEIITFHPLTMDDLSKICDIILVEVAQKLSKKKVSLKVSRAAKQFLIKYGSNVEYGARPLKRAVRSMLEDKLSEKLISGEIGPDTTVYVELRGNSLNIRKG